MMNSKQHRSKLSLAFICVLLIAIMAFTGCSPIHISAPTPGSSPEIADAPAGLPISASVNLLPYGKGRLEEFRNPEYLAATEGCIHASASISLSQESTVRLILESDCLIDWCGDWDNPRPQIGIIFPQMRTYTEDSGWVTISSRAMETRQVVASNGGKQLEVMLTVHPDNSGANIPNIYKLLAINLDQDSPHYLKYDISLYSGEFPPEASSTAPKSVTPVSGATDIDDIFLSCWGHTYYNNAPRASYSESDVTKLIGQFAPLIHSHYQWDVFDCSEITAYLEYVLEHHGYTAEIAVGAMKNGGHAWLMVYDNVGKSWLPIEATLPITILNPELIGLMQRDTGINYLKPYWRWATIYDVSTTLLDEFDWWTLPFADELVQASDKVKVEEVQPSLPGVKYPELPPLPEIKYPDLPPLPDLKR